MKAQHTPGPWRWEPEDESHDQHPVLLGSDGQEVCGFGSYTHYDQRSGNPPEECDMALIAAAPELLLAVQSLMNLFEQHEAQARIKSPVGDYARAAIAKATGSDAARDEGGL